MYVCDFEFATVVVGEPLVHPGSWRRGLIRFLQGPARGRGSRESRGDGNYCCGVAVGMETNAVGPRGMEQNCAGFPSECSL